MGWISQSSNLGPNWLAGRITHLFHLADYIFLFWLATRIDENRLQFWEVTEKSPRSHQEVSAPEGLPISLKLLYIQDHKRVSRSQQSEELFYRYQRQFQSFKILAHKKKRWSDETLYLCLYGQESLGWISQFKCVIKTTAFNNLHTP